MVCSSSLFARAEGACCTKIIYDLLPHDACRGRVDNIPGKGRVKCMCVNQIPCLVPKSSGILLRFTSYLFQRSFRVAGT